MEISLYMGLEEYFGYYFEKHFDSLKLFFLFNVKLINKAEQKSV